MIIFYFKKDIVRNSCGYCNYGNFYDCYFTSRKTLIEKVSTILENDGEMPLSKREVNSIIYKEIPDFDFWTVQSFVDGFGNDTFTVIAFRTFEEAKRYVINHYNYDENMKIVGQWFGAEYKNSFD